MSEAAPSPADTSVVDCGLYVDGTRQGGTLDYRDASSRARETGEALMWLGLRAPSRSFVDRLGRHFGLHQVVVDQMAAPCPRPKLVTFGGVSVLVVKTAAYVKKGELTATSEVVETGHIVIVVGENFVITVRRGAHGALTDVRKHLEERPGRLRQGPWTVAHAIANRLVDQYLDVVSDFEQDVDDVEAAVFSRNRIEIPRVYQLKRELVEFKRAGGPLMRPLDTLASGQIREVPHQVRRYFAYLADHHHRVMEQASSFDDLLTSILQATLSQVSIQQNNDMRKISAWAAIAAAETTIAGIYGMNFKHMPELHWKYGYAGVWVVMIGVAVVMYRLFRRSGWL